MKKIVLVTMVLMYSALAASADVYVQWRAGAGFYFSATPSSGILGPGQSALAQLIWRPNNTGLIAGGDAAYDISPNHVSGDDIWLADYVLTEGVNTSEWGDFNAGAYSDFGAQANSGYVYARVFESNTIVAGTRYYVAPLLLADNLNSSDPLVTPQPYQLNTDLVWGDSLDAQGFTVQPVPEPGTMALFALGLATLGVSRRRRKVQA